MFLKKLYKILLIVFTISVIDIINATALTPNIGSPIMVSNVAEDKQRYYCVQLLLGSSDEGTTTLMEQAAAAGSNAVMLVVDWGYVYKGKNSSADWANLDKKVKRARELGLKIFIRVNLSRHSSVFGDFWTDAESMIDGAGNKLDNNGRSFSFGAQTVVDRALAFVKETAERYNYAQQAGDLLAISIVTTPTQEAGYHYSNENSNGTYPTLFDYSPLFIDGFRLWLQNKYKDIRRLNEVWFSAYGIIDSFDNVNPPFDPNYLQGSFAFKSGLDWYLYRHQMLKKFMDSVSQTIKNVNPTYKVINEYGSVYDGLGQRRGTFGFRDLGTNTDGIKINNEHSSPHKFSTDLIRSNLPGKWIMNEMFPEPNVPISEMFRFGDECFEHGCKLITFVVADQRHLDYFKPAITYFKQKWLNVPLEVIKPAATMTVKLSEILNGNGYDQPGYKAQWNELYEQYKKPIEILLAEDIIQKEGNIAPTIDAGITNQSTVMGFSWKFQIPSDAFQDVDGFVASYETAGLPNGLLLKNSTIIGMPTVAGKFQITVKCFDNSNASVSTNFTLVVKAASKIDIQLYKSGTLQTRQLIKTLKKNDTLYLSKLNYAVNFMAVADGSVAAVNLKMTGAINQEKLDANTPYSLFDDNGGSILKVGQYTITANSYSASTNVSVSNGVGWQEFSFTVLDKPKNTAPTVQNLIPNQTTKVNNSFSLSILTNTFKDAESAISHIQITGLPAGLIANGWSISGKSSQKGSFVIVVEAFDADGLSVKTQFTILINAANIPPYLEHSLSDQTIISGNKFKYDAVGYAFNDRDGSIAKIEVTGLPPGLTYKDGFISGISTAIGSYPITARATDNEGAIASTTFKIIIKDSKPKNTAPIVARVVGNQTAKVGINFSFSVPDLTFEDAEKNINRITITGLAPGLSANNLSISGIPTQSGSFTVTLEAFDTGGLSVKTQFVIVVSPANIPPYLEYSLSDQTIISGNKFKYDAVGYAFNDRDGSIAKIEVTGLPPGLTYKDGFISGISTAIGSYPITARATDNEGATASTTFKIIIKDSKPKNTAPIVARVVGNQTAKVGINFSFSVPDLTFEDAEKNINRITITGLAPGLSANILSISGVPTQSGSFTVTLEAFDTGGLSVKTQFVIVVSPANIPPYLEYFLDNQTALANNMFKYDVVGYAFNDKDGTIAKIEVTGLPPELTYKDGLISGTPTTLGVYEVTAKATDNEGASVSATFKITVKDSKPIFEAVLISAGDVYSRRQIMVLTDGKIITSALPSLLNIYVSPASIDVDRIDFEISGTTQSKNSDSGYPYSLYEGEAGFISKNGKYQLKIISYLKGKSNGSQTINFEIKN